MTAWEKVINFIADKKLNDIITRKELLEVVSCKQTTLDSYRNYLHQVGILETIKPGVYKKAKNIRKNLTISEIVDAAYIHRWKSWFLKFD